MAKFQTAGIIVKFNDASVSNTLHDVVELLHTLSIEVLLDHSTRSLVEDAPTVAMRELGERCDVVIVIGGDGTLLHAARELVDYNIPLIGVNRGRLGFLVDVPPGNDLLTLRSILENVYQAEDRFLLEVKAVSYTHLTLPTIYSV